MARDSKQQTRFSRQIVLPQIAAKGQSGSHQLAVRNSPIHQSPVERLLRADGLAEEAELHRPGLADQARQDPAQTSVGNQGDDANEPVVGHRWAPEGATPIVATNGYKD